MAMTLTVAAKGRITLRRDLLRHLGAKPGDRLHVDLLGDGSLQLRPKRGKPASSIFGLLGESEAAPLTVAEIKDSTERGWAGEG